MATKKKKVVDETIEPVEAHEELIKSEEVIEQIPEVEIIQDISHHDFTYELKVDGTVEKVAKEIEETIKATPAVVENTYTVKKIEGNNIFAINKDGKYIMLRKQGKYANIKFGDTISQ